METLRYTTMDSPLGKVLLAGGAAGLERINFLAGNRPCSVEPDWREDEAPFREALRQLRAYFAGELMVFDLPLHPRGTSFQQRVWSELRAIPYAETISYGELARRIGRPTASRAVGASNGRNPLPIVVPCHRVIGSTGKLTGFAGGLHLKEALLDLERRHGGRAPYQPDLL